MLDLTDGADASTDSSSFEGIVGVVWHGSNGIVSFSWVGLLVIWWCSMEDDDDVDGCVGVKNDDDGDDELCTDGRVESN